ncbi:metallophosphoesterase [Halobacillus halophilus]|uniref:metallophosphoesterase n=1 Tax=Halobacillus halophilus TaxID=1570 RepID=UPI001CD744EB|nr:metallophosphoesterase [Halobacillus halophilus]MCA1010766.1 metallophosphoesterase [Halobacillus halophilus]
MKIRLGFLALMILLGAASIGKAIYDTNVFKVNHVNLESSELPAGEELEVLQITDLHNKVFGDDNEKLIRTAEELNPDLIVITGDLVDHSTKQFQQVFDLSEKLKAIQKDVYYVSGNHEWENEKTEELFQGLRERNVTMLDNTHVTYQREDTKIHIAGVADSSTDHENIKQAFAGIDNNAYTIFLSHSPNIVTKYDDIPADLILSGHTHGGQVRFPFIGAVVAPDQGLFPDLTKGVYQVDAGSTLYIDSGLGTSIAPVRFWNQSQMTLLTLSGSNEAD